MASILLSFEHHIDNECIFIVLDFYENQKSNMAVMRNRICVKNALFCRLISLDVMNRFSICKRCLNRLLVSFDMYIFFIFLSFVLTVLLDKTRPKPVFGGSALTLDDDNTKTINFFVHLQEQKVFSAPFYV